MKDRSGILEAAHKSYSELVLRGRFLLSQHQTFIVALLGLIGTSLFFADPSFGKSGAEVVAAATSGGTGQQIWWACAGLLAFIEGPFGALVCVGAGIAAICAAAFGGFKMAWALIVISVGAFILRGYLTLFFVGCG